MFRKDWSVNKGSLWHKALNGKVQSEMLYKKGVPDGISKTYHKNDKVNIEATYKNGVQVGVQKDYYQNGKLKIELPLDKNGLIDGVGREIGRASCRERV